MSNLVLSWNEVHEAGVGVAGGKGWNLARLARYGLPVPAGAVLSTEVYRAFVWHNNLQTAIAEMASNISVENIHTESTLTLLETLRSGFLNGTFPPYFHGALEKGMGSMGLLFKPLAVRSSASCEDSQAASFAGIHESYLNVLGHAQVITAIKCCFASLWTQRAVAYRRKMNIPDQAVEAAIVLMELVHAQAAGVAFTCDPGTGREDVIIIGANFGLGESVVSGVIESDDYRLDAHSLAITKKAIGRKEKFTVIEEGGGTQLVAASDGSGKQVLGDDDILKLGLLIRRVFAALGDQHQDIEWVFDGKSFFLVQVRPVTALPRYTCAGLEHQADVWSNGNFRDAAPMVQTTFGAHFLKHHVNHILEIPFKLTGYPATEGMQYIKLFQGRAYCNLSLLQWLWYDALAVTPRETNMSMGGHQPEISIDEKVQSSLAKKWRRGWRVLTFFHVLARYKTYADQYFQDASSFTRNFRGKDLSAFDGPALLKLYFEIDKRLEVFSAPFIMLTCTSGFSMALTKEIDKSLPGRGMSLANALVAGGGNITSANQGYRLLGLATIAHHDDAARQFFTHEPFVPAQWKASLPDDSPFRQGLETFLEEFGHRAVYEIDIHNPRWQEDPTYLLNFIRRSINAADLETLQAMQREKAGNAWCEIKQHMPVWRHFIIRSLVKQAIAGVELKEMAKSSYVKLLEPLRQLMLEIGRRFFGKGLLHDRADIFHCAPAEIISILRGEWDGESLLLLVAERKKKKAAQENIAPPDVIVNGVPEYTQPVAVGSGKILTGMGVAAGRASGAVRRIFSPDEDVSLMKGEVLVAPSTEPSWTPLFLNAVAVVVETGGYLSHGSIVAREYGIPAVVNIPGVMKALHNGQHIVVDGDAGKVYLSEER